MTALLTTAYWPNLHYFYYLLRSDQSFIEGQENYQKQSYRNRTHILSANGLLPLSIPVHKAALKELSSRIAISYQERWQGRHWGAIISAYKNSPYFDYFEEDIRYFYTRRFDLLFDYNQQQLQTILRLLKLKKELRLTQEFLQDNPELTDCRLISELKADFRKDAVVGHLLETPYYQTFSHKFPFYPNLSILDLLFNKGLETLSYLGS